jgi:predicted ArsR family transcriptional regulator
LSLIRILPGSAPNFNSKRWCYREIVAKSRWHAIAALVDPVRRALYEYVRRQRRAVTREEAAAAQAISRSLTAFHLDKLVASGLLRARYEAPAGEPRGRGRKPKVYEAAGEVVVTVPPRRYDLVGEIMADALAAGPAPAGEAALREAYDRGQAAGSERRVAGDGTGELAQAGEALAEVGFEPVEEPGRLVLANCPFSALVARQPELICGINHAYVRGLLAGLDAGRLTARLAPRPDACCVEVCLAPG